MRKIVTTIITMMTIVILNGAIAFASPETAKVVVIDGVYVTFDSVYYAETNPDVVAAVGTDEDALLQHFINAGQYEGRLPSAPYTQVGTSKILNQKIYGSQDLQMFKMPVKEVYYAADGSIIRTQNTSDTFARYEFDQYGNIVVDNIGETTIIYFDGLGNMVRIKQPIFPERPDITYDNTYDSENRLIKTVGHMGLDHKTIYITDYTYDAQGRLKEIRGGYQGKEQDFREVYIYNETGRLVERVQNTFLEALPFPGFDQDVQVGLRYPYEYDDQGRIIQIGGIIYTYDDAGNIKTRRTEENRPGWNWSEYIYE